MSAFDRPESRRTAIFIIVILVVVILILGFVFGGVEGIFGIIKFVTLFAMIVGFIGFVFFVVYYLFFKKHPRNLTIENWKTYVKSALDNGADMMSDLILTGDSQHSAKRFMTIKGYLRIMAFDNKEYDMFIGKKQSMNPFEEWKAVILEPNQHSELIGDVFVSGISLIQKYGYYFVNTMMLNYTAIDKSIAYDTYRTLMFENLGDLKQIFDRAVGLDPEWRKEQLSQKLLKIPVLSGQQGGQQQQQE